MSERVDVLYELRRQGVTGSVYYVVAELVEAVKTQRTIAAESGPWLQPDVRPAFALLVGLDRFATRAEITKRADENVAAALARFGGAS